MSLWGHLMNIDSRFHACIIAGGSGERFWPMSRASSPKHLLKLFSERTLLEEALLRLRGVVADENVWILTNAQQVPAIRREIPWFPASQIIAEPEKRDTAPAAALATGLVRARDPRAVLALLPADALISDAPRFASQLRQAFQWAADDAGAGTGRSLLTFAVTPSYAATGFGYLELGEDVARGAEGSRLRRAVRFVEKPDLATARSYLAGGNHAWNAGIFVWGVGRFLEEVERSSPELAAFIKGFPKGDPAAYLQSRFPSLPKISVDYAVMEKARSVATVIAEFGWDDVGSWAALPGNLGTDGAGNTFKGPVVAVDTHGSVAVSSGRLIALCGVDDLVVVETPDAILVCHRGAVQHIKKLMPLLPKDAT